jgi:hypothetical protein
MSLTTADPAGGVHDLSEIANSVKLLTQAASQIVSGDDPLA